MKPIKILCGLLWGACLAGSVSFAQTVTNDATFKLLNIMRLDGPVHVLLDVGSMSDPSKSHHLVLAEGERKGTVELLRVDAAKGTAELMADGRKLLLELAKPNLLATRPDGAGGIAQSANAQLGDLLKPYAHLKGRTLLLHPGLNLNTGLTVVGNGSKEEMISAFEKTFWEHGIVALPDGDKFVLLVPATLTNAVAVDSREAVAKLLADKTLRAEESLPEGVLDFRGALATQALRIYAELWGRKLTTTGELPVALIYFQNETALNKAEAIYAFNTLFAWNGIALTPGEGQTLTAKPAAR
jgi:hypothetical protein